MLIDLRTYIFIVTYSNLCRIVWESVKIVIEFSVQLYTTSVIILTYIRYMHILNTMTWGCDSITYTTTKLMLSFQLTLG